MVDIRNRRYRVLVHLKNYYKLRDAVVAAHAVTQEGMSVHTKIRQSHLSEILNELRKEGLVYTKLAYVHGKKRKVKAYFLTEEGLRTVQQLELPAPQIQFSDVLPTYKYFFGRFEEIDIFKKWLASSNYRILALDGIAGIGKSAFTVKCIRKFVDDRYLFWYKVCEYTTLRNLCEKFADFFITMNNYKLKSYLMENVKIDVQKFMPLLEEGLKDKPCILVFDDVHKAEQKIADFLKSFTETCSSLHTTKLVIIGREISRFYNVLLTKLNKLVLHLTLQGLDRNASFAILSRRNIVPSEYEKLYTLTKGHPLALQIIEKPADVLTETDLSRYITDEIYSTLSDDERHVLDYISVYRYPIPTSLIYSFIPAKKYKIVENLVSKNLVVIFENAFGLHEILKEYIYARLPPSTRKKAHKIASDYYLKLGTDLGYLESMHHLICAEDLKTAFKLVAEYGNIVLSHGLVDELAYILNSLVKLDLKQVSSEDVCEFFSLKGDVAELKGMWSDALSDYTEALKFCKNTVKSAEICRKIGLIYQRMGEYENAIQWFEKWLFTLGSDRDKIAPTKLYDCIAWVYYLHGDYKTSLKYYRLCYKTALALHDLDEIGKASANLGAYYYQTGSFKNALHYFKKSLEVRKKLNQHRELAAVHNNVGSVYEMLGELSAAEKHYNESLNILTNIGDISNCSILYTNLGTIALRSNRATDALKLFQKSAEMCEKIGEKYGLALASVGIAESLVGLKKMDDAEQFCKKAVAISKKYSYFDLLANAYCIYGLYHHTKGDLKNARFYLEECIKLFERFNLKLQLAKAYYLMATVLLAHKKLDLQKTAKTYLEKAYAIFKTAGYDGERAVLKHIEDILKETIKYQP